MWYLTLNHKTHCRYSIILTYYRSVKLKCILTFVLCNLWMSCYNTCCTLYRTNCTLNNNIFKNVGFSYSTALGFFLIKQLNKVQNFKLFIFYTIIFLLLLQYWRLWLRNTEKQTCRSTLSTCIWNAYMHIGRYLKMAVFQILKYFLKRKVSVRKREGGIEWISFIFFPFISTLLEIINHLLRMRKLYNSSTWQSISLTVCE